MCLSGALAGFVGVNEIIGVHHRIILNFHAGYGFTGIAVALMGRNHPLGVVLASILFGILNQGGAELAFEIPTIDRNMVAVIQGLVILFSGALAISAPLARGAVRRAVAPRSIRDCGRPDGSRLLLLTLSATLRLSTPLILCAMAGLLSERSGLIDIGLEGKMLAAAFAAASVAAVTGSPGGRWHAGIVTATALRVAAWLCLHHPSRQSGGERRRHQSAGLGPHHRARQLLVPAGRADAAADRISDASGRSSCRASAC